MRDMILIPQQQPERVFPGRQSDLSLALGVAEVQMIEIRRDRLVQRRQLGIDQQMVVPGIRTIYTRPRQLHATKPKTNRRLGWNQRAILEIEEINRRSSR